MVDKENSLDSWLNVHFFPSGSKKSKEEEDSLTQKKRDISLQARSKDSWEGDITEDGLKELKAKELEKWKFLKKSVEEDALKKGSFSEELYENSFPREGISHYQSLLKEIPSKISFLNSFFQKVKKESKAYETLVSRFNKKLDEITPPLKNYNKDVALNNLRPESEEKMRLMLLNVFRAGKNGGFMEGALEETLSTYNQFVKKRNELIDSLNEKILAFNNEVLELNWALKPLNQYRSELKLAPYPVFQPIALITKISLAEIDSRDNLSQFSKRSEVLLPAPIKTLGRVSQDAFFSSPLFLSKLSVITLGSVEENLLVLKDCFTEALGELSEESSLNDIRTMALSNYVNIYLKQSVPLYHTLEALIQNENVKDKEAFVLKFKLFALSILFYAALLSSPHALRFLSNAKEIEDMNDKALKLASSISFANMILEIISSPFLDEEIAEVFQEFFPDDKEIQIKGLFQKIKSVLKSSLSLSAFMAVSHALKEPGFSRQISASLIRELNFSNEVLPNYEFTDLLDETAFQIELKKQLVNELLTLSLSEDEAQNMANMAAIELADSKPFTSLTDFINSLSACLKLSGVSKFASACIAFKSAALIQKGNPYLHLTQSEENRSFFWPHVVLRGFENFLPKANGKNFKDEDRPMLEEAISAAFLKFSSQEGKVLLSTWKEALKQELILKSLEDEKAALLAKAQLDYLLEEQPDILSSDISSSEVKLFLYELEQGLLDRSLQQKEIERFLLGIQSVLLNYPALIKDPYAVSKILEALDMASLKDKNPKEKQIENELEALNFKSVSKQAIAKLFTRLNTHLTFEESLKIALKNNLKDLFSLSETNVEKIAAFGSLTLSSAKFYLSEMIEKGAIDKVSTIPRAFKSPLDFRIVLKNVLELLGYSKEIASRSAINFDFDKLWGQEGGALSFETIFKTHGFNDEANALAKMIAGTFVGKKDIEQMIKDNLTLLLYQSGFSNFIETSDFVKEMELNKIVFLDELKLALLQRLRENLTDELSLKIAHDVISHLGEKPFALMDEPSFQDAIFNLLILYGQTSDEKAKEIADSFSIKSLWNRESLKHEIEKVLIIKGKDKVSASAISLEAVINLFVLQIPPGDAKEAESFALKAMDQSNAIRSPLRNAIFSWALKKSVPKEQAENLALKAAQSILNQARELNSVKCFQKALFNALKKALADEDKSTLRVYLTGEMIKSISINPTPGIRKEILNESLLQILLSSGFDISKAPFVALELTTSLCRSPIIFETESLFKQAVIDTISAWSLVPFDLATHEVNKTSFGLARAGGDFGNLLEIQEKGPIVSFANKIYNISKSEFKRVVNDQKAAYAAEELILVLFGSRNQKKPSLYQLLLNGYREIMNCGLKKEITEQALLRDIKGFIHPSMEALIVLNRLFEPASSLCYTMLQASNSKKRDVQWQGGLSV